MLLERAERWPQQWREEGRQEGRQEGRLEGRQEGRREGKVELLKALAGYRFGELPRSAVERFDRADIDTLERWSRRLLEAKRLEDIFGVG